MRPDGTAHRDDSIIFINFICGSSYQYRLAVDIDANFSARHTLIVLRPTHAYTPFYYLTLIGLSYFISIH